MYRFAVAAAVILATSAVASASPFLGIGIGTGGSVNGALVQQGFKDDGRSGRIMGGFAFPLTTGRLSIEGLGTWWDLSGNPPYSAKQGAIAARYNFPLGNSFEVFGRVGLVRTWLSGIADFAGNGTLLGAGFEYRFTSVSLFVDYTHTTSTLDDGSGAFNWKTSPNMWTAGLTVSF